MHRGGWWSYFQYDSSRDRPEVDRALVARIFHWARPYSGRIAVMMTLLLIIALIELIPPLLYGALINGLSEGTLTMSRLNLLAIGLLGVPALSSLIGVGQRQISASVGEGIIYDLRVAMYGHMQRMGLRFFTDTKTGDIISRFASDVVGAQSAVTDTIPNLATNALTLVTTLAVMLRLEWRLTLLAIVVLPLFLIPTRRVGRVLREIRREAAKRDATMSSQVQETVNVSGALLVRTFGRQTDVTSEFDDAARDVRDIGIRRAVVGRWFFFGLGLATAIGTALLYWVGGYLAIQGEMSVGLIVTFAAYVGRLYGPITGLSNIQVQFATSLVSFERVFEYLDLPVEVDESEDAIRLEQARGDVAFDDVCFRYGDSVPAVTAIRAEAATGEPEATMADSAPEHTVADGDREPTVADGEPEYTVADGERKPTVDDGDDGGGDGGAALEDEPSARGGAWALNDVSFEARRGQVVALVGPSGAGKTTVTYLVARLYDPTEGRVTLDGRDLRSLRLEDVARHVGMVTQESFLFHDTVRANLLFARPNASHDQVEDACRAANIHDVILGMPDGYETVVGERGYRMSGGEKQRIALARVILNDPTVLVLDEATSHLDSQSEALIQDALERLMRGRTSLVIAHRLSTILAADLILVFDGGRIVERGTHDELMSGDGLYAELYETQFRDRQ